ncbi:MAG: hypothetical protein LC781_14280 [Actinobacteria bacterium]|nr:hypothetical protein [Actinomycetota bacterium]
MIREAIEWELADAGWRVDNGFAGHLLVGNAGDLSILVPWRAWRGADPAYELYDVEKHVACWVRVIPTPLRARMILEEHGESPEERGQELLTAHEG